LPEARTSAIDIARSHALVTGANGGIGRALVAALCRRGARRVYAAARNPDRLPLEVLADPRVAPLQLDITDADSVRVALEAAADIDLLFNNAGVAALGGILDNPLEFAARDMNVNYLGTLRMIRAAAPVIEGNGGGAIVNVLSVLALAGKPALGGYSASKAAVLTMTELVRAALAPRGITVHAAFPGPTDTPMLAGREIAKADPAVVAGAIVAGLAAGEADILVDAHSQHVHAAWRDDPRALMRAFARQ